MLKRVAQAIWGKFESRDEVLKFGLLGLMFGFIIGAYWGLRPIKDGIFAEIVGFDYQPMAKWVSLVIVSTLVVIYGKLIDTFPRHRVFYILTIAYFIAAMVFWWALAHPVYGLPNCAPSPYRMVGWMWYVFVESYGSLIVAMFWGFTTDITSDESGRRGFPLIALFGQMGNIFGPLFMRAKYLGFVNSAPIAAIAGVLTLATALLMWVFMKVVPKSQFVGYGQVHHVAEKHDEEPGFLEGLKLLVTKSYLLGIFAIISIYEVIITIIDFQFKSAAKHAFPVEVDYSEYLANYAVATGILATVCVLLGINSIQRMMGITAALVLVPLLVAVGVVMVWINPTSLETLFWVMVIGKAINYALNSPTQKQLYIPTSKDTKYKAQAWIEMFGSRGSKAAGSGVNAMKLFFKKGYGAAGVSMFATVSALSSLGLIGVWLLAVVYVAKTYNKAVAENKLVC